MTGVLGREEPHQLDRGAHPGQPDRPDGHGGQAHEQDDAPMPHDPSPEAREDPQVGLGARGLLIVTPSPWRVAPRHQHRPRGGEQQELRGRTDEHPDRREHPEHADRLQVAVDQRQQAEGGGPGREQQRDGRVRHRPVGRTAWITLPEGVQVVIREMDRPRHGRDVDQRDHGDRDRVQRRAGHGDDGQAQRRAVDAHEQHECGQPEVTKAEPRDQQAQQPRQAEQPHQGTRALPVQRVVDDGDPAESHLARWDARRSGCPADPADRGIEPAGRRRGEEHHGTRLPSVWPDHDAAQAFDGQ